MAIQVNTKDGGGSIEPDPSGEPDSAEQHPTDRDQTVIELAIERALDSVRVELEDAATVAVEDADAGGGAPGTPSPIAAEATKDVDSTDAAPGPAKDAVRGATESEVDDKTAAPRPDDSAPATVIALDDNVAVADQAAPREEPGEPAPVPQSPPLTQLLARMAPPASLEELGKALTSSGGQSLDEVAEGIMRPVIREWLANNLATMAEKIVRQEIERVSRNRG